MKLIALLRKLDDNTWTDLIFLEEGKIKESKVGYAKTQIKKNTPRNLDSKVVQVRMNKQALQILVRLRPYKTQPKLLS